MLRAKGTSITRFIEFGTNEPPPATKWIKFTDVGLGEGTLDQYLLGRHAPPVGTRGGKFRPIGTSDNEIVMFPATATIRLCTVVAQLFSKSLSTYTTDSTPLVEPFLLNTNDREEADEPEEPFIPVPILDRRKMSLRGEPMQSRKPSGSTWRDFQQTTIDRRPPGGNMGATKTTTTPYPQLRRHSLSKR